MGKMSRDKGQRGEREVCALLQVVVDRVYADMGKGVAPPLKRNLEQTRAGGFDIAGLDWLAIEVKFHETITEGKIAEWWLQAKRQAGTDGKRRAVLVWRKSRSPWQVKAIERVVVDGKGFTLPVVMSLSAYLVLFETRLRNRLVADC